MSARHVAPPGGREVSRGSAHLDSLGIDGDRISARLRAGGREHTLAYRVRGASLADRYEPFLVAALPIAMRYATALTVDGPISPRLLANLDTIQRILNAWDARLRVIEVEAPPGAPELEEGRGTMSFFSGGVDSFYTALRNLDELDALVYVHGFDVSVGNRLAAARMSSWIRATATELGRPVVEVETNVREFGRLVCPWWLYAGPVLASVALLVGRGFDTALIPASRTYRDLIPRGTHVLLDPLWSTEAVEIVHEGVAARIEKLEAISGSELAMRRLRVCWVEDVDGNCGRCGKCLRTMAALQIVGQLERCDALPDRVPLFHLWRLPVRSPETLTYVSEALDVAERRGAGSALTTALRAIERRAMLYLALRPEGGGSVARAWRQLGRVDRRLRRATGGRNW